MKVDSFIAIDPHKGKMGVGEARRLIKDALGLDREG
jgi:hypothetical protein